MVYSDNNKNENVDRSLPNIEEALEEKEAELSKANEHIKLLENKIENAEAELFQEISKFKYKKDDFIDEIKLLKQSIKNSNMDNLKQNKEILELKKLVKLKEKETNKANQKIDNFFETNRKLKEDVSKLKKRKESCREKFEVDGE